MMRCRLSAPRGLPRTGAIILLLWLLVGLPGGALAGGVADELRMRLEDPSPGAALSVLGERVHAEPTLRRFYNERRHQPAWSSDGAPHAKRVEAAQALLELARRHGLAPGDYHAGALARVLETLAESGPDTVRLAELDLLLTDAMLLLASHFENGRLDPVAVDPQWHAAREDSRDYAAFLDDALQADALEDRVARLLPADPGYRRLVEAYRDAERALRDAAWPQVPEGPTLRRGDDGVRVEALARRLAASGDLDGDPSGAFDDALHDAVVAFQGRNGLEPDGLVGPATRRALNMTPADRAERIRVNLERWRWLPRSLGERHVRVNIAGFDMVMVDDGEEVFSGRVVVGRDYRRTPVFSGRMTYLVLNPRWEVPNSIAVNDILPQVRRDPDYLERMGFQVLQGWGSEERLVDPEAVDWERLGRGAMPYRFRQAPGPLNAMGQVKFMFPNRFNVYLHDTPARELFQRARRDFSSGCIRIERPLEFARIVLDDPQRWDAAAIDRTIDGAREQTVTLRRPVMVHMQYATVWAEPDGTLQWREDIYSRDEPVRAALASLPPGPSGEGRH